VFAIHPSTASIAAQVSRPLILCLVRLSCESAGGEIPAAKVKGEMPEARAAYQKALSMSQQEPEKRFFKKRLAELSNLGDAKRLRVQDK
jgi:hypothetical protein